MLLLQLALSPVFRARQWNWYFAFTSRWACLFPTSEAHCAWASHSCPTPPWFTEISSSHQGILAKRPPSSTPSHPAPAWHSTEKWLTVPESILQKTLNLGVRDSNPDCCSQVYPETGRKAIYLLDLKLATCSHQWDPVRLLYSDSAFKNSRSHWANSSSSWGCQLVEAG